MEQTKNTTIRRQRWDLLIRIDSFMNVPMNVLAFIWLILTVIDIVNGLGEVGQLFITVIWIMFGIQFLVEYFLAPAKKIYFKHNWLTALALILPAFRIFRVYRALSGLRLVRGSYFIRILSSIDRGMKALAESFSTKGLGYVIGVTCIVILAGAAGIMSFESTESHYFDHYGTALWWTCMMITTMGSDYFPKSAEGRLLALILAIYGFAIFGYVTARVATFFLEKDGRSTSKVDKELSDIELLQKEVREIKDIVLKLRGPSEKNPS